MAAWSTPGDDDRTLYDILGVAAAADAGELRTAYRLRALALHPDRFPSDAPGQDTGPTGSSCAWGAAPDALLARTVAMAELNVAWAVLSDADRRARYDAGIVAAAAGAAARATPPPPPWPAGARGGPEPAGPGPSRSRREAWVAGLRVQVVRLAGQAGRSAAMGLAVRRRGLPRVLYLDALELILTELARDTDRRVREARAAGAAPLDLGLVTGLVGLRRLAAAVGGLDDAARRRAVAEMVDRMWDTLAYELPREVERRLGGNPHASRAGVRDRPG